MKVIIWGAGRYLFLVLEALREDTEVVAIVDSDPSKHGKIINNIKVILPFELDNYRYDAIIISPLKSASSIEDYLETDKYCNKRIINIWKCEEETDILKSRNEIILDSIEQKEIYRARIDSAPYEWGLRKTPEILSAMLLLKKVMEDKCSLCRYGDGEFNIMLNDGNPWFQEYHPGLAQRLIQIINEKNDHVLIAIAQNFREFEKYTEDAADAIRLYMKGEKRKRILSLLPDRTFYDAYVSRPYIIYRDKNYADTIFRLIKSVWNDRNVLIVEGKYSRLGVGNDLFSTARDIKRIICPSSDAWHMYDAILRKVIEYAKLHKCLVCISLGPTATVLAHDLGVVGVQALDIGQVDNEYEWWKVHASERVQINGKMVAEVSTYIDDTCMPQSYYDQIVEYIL